METSYQNLKPVHCFISTLIIFTIIYVYNTNYLRNKSNTEKTYATPNNLPLKPVSRKENYSGLAATIITTNERIYNKNKYILLWTEHRTTPFVYLGDGNTVFKARKCKFTNCFVTSDRDLLGHYSKFDVIAFHGPELLNVIGRDDIPKIRSAYQKYVYANIEAAKLYPICGVTWDRFFNWTWTYKLNSDAVWGYFLVKNASNHVVGPRTNMDWIKEVDMDPIDDKTKAKLAGKTKAAAWFVSNCVTNSEREVYVEIFQRCLNVYNLYIDVYGTCGDLWCPKSKMDMCLDELQSDYYFYLAFENALSEDYVTEKFLHALQHYTVPVVYGGANYTRFLPPGSYLDAIELGPQQLAKRIHEIIQHPEQYHEFFKWRKYYSYHLRWKSPETDDYCHFCAMLNDDVLVNKSSAYDNFGDWWSPGAICGSAAPGSVN